MTRYLSVTETAKQSGIARKVVWNLARSGKLGAVNVSTGERPTWMIPEDAFEKLSAGLPPGKTPRALKRTGRIDAGMPNVFGDS